MIIDIKLPSRNKAYCLPAKSMGYYRSTLSNSELIVSLEMELILQVYF